MKKIEVPEHLSAPSKVWFKRVVRDYEMEGHHLHMLRLAAEALDRGEAARRVVEAEGMSFKDRNGLPKMRPEALIQRDAAILFARLCRELQLDAELPVEPRIPRKGGR